ncbi:SRPBCC family protein [Georgenia yuyongxinii]|uniref:SRPBCC family protein n=1 Tax=Georgenia yuyongxinii TaxID=2589797 RepID=A0A552WW23_9MICO|nr:SRPBCC family protein [Georgenia yuyongxinii]TRW46994.1 SRPBCC family protein [Georgenia yuyongxinii]
MSPQPSGALARTPSGLDLILVREFASPPAQVWATLTESARTVKWFGSWTGTPGTGGVVRVRMVHEDGEHETTARIDACEPPKHLAVTTGEEAGGWRLEMFLVDSGDGGTILRFVHHLPADAPVADTGVGWDFYLDNFAAAHEDRPLVVWDDYYPALLPYYEALAEQA